MNRSRPWAATLLVLGATSAATMAWAQADTLIVPGARMGSIALGMSAKQLLAAAGAPTNADSGDKGAQYWWGKTSAAATVRPDAVTTVSTEDPRYRTADGLGVGSSELQIRASLGVPKCVAAATGVHRSPAATGHVLVYNGIAFEFSVGLSGGAADSVWVARDFRDWHWGPYRC